MNLSRRWSLLLAVALLPACSQRREPRPQGEPAAATATATATATDPAAELDRMDQRKPVPLLPMMASHQKANMRDHLVAIEQITTALATDDLAATAVAARKLGSSPEMGTMCTHMGEAAPGFTEQALAFHQTADGIATAAEAGDRAGVVAALGKTLAACTGCHATWKQQVVDEPTWERLAAAARTAPPSP